MLKRKLLISGTVLALGIGSISASPFVTSAESINNLKEKQSEVKEQRSEIESDLDSVNDKISDLQDQQAKLDSEIKRIDIAVEDTNAKIREKNTEIEETNAEIEKLKAEIEELKERIAKRTEVLKQRAVSFQESGGSVSYLQVILGASSFSDFVSRVSAVSTIMEADENLVKQHEDDKTQLEVSQKEVEEKLASLKTMKAELETMKADLSKQKAEKDKLMGQLKIEEEEAHNHALELEEETAILKAQEASLAKAMELEKKRQEEEAAAKKAAEAAGNKSPGSSSSSSSSNSSGSSSSVSNSTPAVSSGMFTRPAAGRFTSGFGARWGKTHYGIDIANSADVPIVAAASGVVSRSYYSSSYGNVIYITHYINGQQYTTVYAHLETRFVGEGATVSKGQQIGIMGNTGRSTGQHLHFELHKGGWNGSKSNAVNPAAYIPL